MGTDLPPWISYRLIECPDKFRILLTVVRTRQAMFWVSHIV
jgi:hypothetical protein